jgi:SAM-dependent methyltransferase
LKARRAASRNELDDRLTETVEAYDRASDSYASRFASVDLLSHRLRFERLVQRGQLILDAGCGSGRDCSLFERDGFAVVGVDLSRGLLATARAVTNAALVLGDIRDLPFPDASFGGIWCCAVLLHLDDDGARTALREMSRVLCHGGQLFVSVRQGKGDEWRPQQDGGGRRWFHLYSADQIATLASSAGFSVDSCDVETGVAIPSIWINLHAHRV